MSNEVKNLSVQLRNTNKNQIKTFDWSIIFFLTKNNILKKLQSNTKITKHFWSSN